MFCSESAFHSCTVLPQLPLVRVLPSSVGVRADTAQECPLRVRMQCRDAISDANRPVFAAGCQRGSIGTKGDRPQYCSPNLLPPTNTPILLNPSLSTENLSGVLIFAKAFKNSTFVAGGDRQTHPQPLNHGSESSIFDAIALNLSPPR
jgi:hypothetical protein